ncbi:protein FAR1-RELATED SEQUENCE 5-like [Arachis hypogaea]|uniref:protein FAR1-RELATED SEQUENCE 5-like n=1 Tax=Arachis hypogaea TaxID=3818 RepID=UPI000DECDB5E|nr:protein FAR1-RELATED SEQUENCE 5-like [Arachis hypogaea]
MHQKEPKVVVTDGDESMKEAIRTEFPNATHRLCTWHLARNAISNIKDNDFCAAFKTAVYGHFEVEEFDQYWADMVAAFRLEENEWIWATYEKRVHWANAYLCDKFCAGLRTTSRCEGINASLKWFIKSSNCLLELVENLERVVKDYRNNEFIADYKSLYLEPVITTGLESIERAMSQIYTREIFFEVKKQIKGVAALIVLHRESSGSTEKFMFRKFRKPRRVYSVLYESNSERYECSCKLWNSIGIPCSHIICVLKKLEKDALPMRLVLKRWSKDAKSGSFDDSDGGLDSNRAFRGWYGSLWTSCLPMCLLAAQRPATYEHAAAKIAQLLKEIEVEVSKGNSSTSVHDTVDGEDILDPKIIKSKGAPRSTDNGKTARRCRRCRGFGHDRRNCTANKEDMLDEVSAKFEVVNGSVTI